MKRKLNEEDVPTPVGESVAKRPRKVDFQSFGLDSRLLQAVVQEGFRNPTPVQAQGIPLALDGKHILARAKTGSGKTVAYVLPILETILRRKTITPKLVVTSALILVPTKELASQVTKVVSSLSTFCAKEIRSLNIAQKASEDVERSLLSSNPDVVIATPTGAYRNISNKALSLENLAYLVIDEADLVLSYGHTEDLENISKLLPDATQTLLMSATLSTDVDTLKGLFCQDPSILTLDDEEEDKSIKQFILKCGEDEKFLYLYILVKLKLIKGKLIVFVGELERCYRVKLFLEQFGVRSCVLNSELPVNSRIHVVEEFNKNLYDVIIASDEHEVLDVASHQPKSKEDPETTATDGPEKEANEPTQAPEASEPKKKKRKNSKRDKEYGISRGIDFKNVACVLNLDLPTSSKSYIHRIGRTARAGKNGMAVSFMIPRDRYRKHKPTTIACAAHDEEVWADIKKEQSKRGQEIVDYQFKQEDVDPFRYRMNDALRAVTGVAVREARTRELRQELIKSDKLQRYFEENPEDLHHLRHDGELRVARTQAHLKHVPDYLVPGGAKQATGDVGFVGLGRTQENKYRKTKILKKGGKGRKSGGRKINPLKSFSSRGKR